MLDDGYRNDNFSELLLVFNKTKCYFANIKLIAIKWKQNRMLSTCGSE